MSLFQLFFVDPSLENLLKHSLSYDELGKLVEQDSWTLSEAVCYLHGKMPLIDLEIPWQRTRILENAISLFKPDLLKSAVAAFELFVGDYKKLERAIIIGNLKTAGYQQIIDGSRSYDRYFVNPKLFLGWCYEKGLVLNPVVLKLIQDQQLLSSDCVPIVELKDEKTSLSNLKKTPAAKKVRHSTECKRKFIKIYRRLRRRDPKSDKASMLEKCKEDRAYWEIRHKSGQEEYSYDTLIAWMIEADKNIPIKKKLKRRSPK